MPMTVILITIISILAITGLAWLATKVLPFPVCPICVGVAGTWLWMVAAGLAGFAFDASMLAILLGGSVVGAAYQLEKHLAPGRSPLLWKALSLPIGFAAAYGVAVSHWRLLAIAGVALLFLTAVFFMRRRHSEKDSAALERLEREMKKCC